MNAFEISYSADEDVLEVTFAVYDENTAKTIPLNDNIFLFSDMSLQSVWAISFYSFSKLLEVSETEFTALNDLTEKQQAIVLNLLSREPASHFFDITYPDVLVARIKAPSIEQLVRSGEA